MAYLKTNPFIYTSLSSSRLITGFVQEGNFLIGRKEGYSLYKANWLVTILA